MKSVDNSSRGIALKRSRDIGAAAAGGSELKREFISVFFFVFFFFLLFTYGCVGSSFLCEGFL